LASYGRAVELKPNYAEAHTLNYNAHTTASDVLWAGLPVLMCLGNTFANRVAGSLLNAVGIPELITPSLQAFKPSSLQAFKPSSLQDYEAMALSLAREPDRITAIKQQLSLNRMKSPLFDTKRHAKKYGKSLGMLIYLSYQRRRVSTAWI
jgi:predicted O-linked N-acetylglucosamine transferase (SPINDLY family)